MSNCEKKQGEEPLEKERGEEKSEKSGEKRGKRGSFEDRTTPPPWLLRGCGDAGCCLNFPSKNIQTVWGGERARARWRGGKPGEVGKRGEAVGRLGKEKGKRGIRGGRRCGSNLRGSAGARTGEVMGATGIGQSKESVASAAVRGPANVPSIYIFAQYFTGNS